VPDRILDALAAMVVDLEEACRQAQEISARIKAEMISQARSTQPLPDGPNVLERRKFPRFGSGFPDD
jgi:hypothetical protein